MTTPLQTEHDVRRRAYMESHGPQSHQDFYCWLADAISVTVDDLPVSIARVVESLDPHFNDIPLIWWDRCDPIIRRRAFGAGMRSWSLSDTVCTLKAFARRAADEQIEEAVRRADAKVERL